MAEMTHDEIVQITDDETSIFAAMGLPDAEEMDEKASHVYEITRAIQEAGMNQSQAAKRAEVTRADMSRILRGRTENVSIARLESILRALGHDEVKLFVPTRQPGGRGTVSVIHSDAVPLSLVTMSRDNH